MEQPLDLEQKILEILKTPEARAIISEVIWDLTVKAQQSAPLLLNPDDHAEADQVNP